MKYCFLTIFILHLIGCAGEEELPDTPAQNLTGYKQEAIKDEDYIFYKNRVTGSPAELGTVSEGHKDGTWIQYDAEGLPRIITSYKNGLKNGPEITYEQPHRIGMIVHYLNNKLHGYYAKFMGRNKLEEGFYRYGNLHGTQNLYFESAQYKDKIQRQMNYKDGKLHGDLIYFDEEGRQTLKYTYENGEKVE